MWAYYAQRRSAVGDAASPVANRQVYFTRYWVIITRCYRLHLLSNRYRYWSEDTVNPAVFWAWPTVTLTDVSYASSQTARHVTINERMLFILAAPKEAPPSQRLGRLI
jgi:hypothetical protein